MEPPSIAAVRRILSENSHRTIADPSLTPAGVMLLFYPRDGTWRVLLTVRSDSVEEHKGEVSFPGGRQDQDDDTLLGTALRETHEEMGIKPQDVEVLGQLDDVATRTNYLVSTFVGAIPSPYPFRPDRREVSQVLEVPVGALMDRDGLRDEVRIVEGQASTSPSYAYGGHLVFGATAKILRQFLELLDSAGNGEAEWKTEQS